MEAHNLRSFWETVTASRREDADDELRRLLGWIADRIATLEQQMTPDGINDALRDRQLFPEPDPLGDSSTDE